EDQLELIAIRHGELVEQVLIRHPGMGHSWVSLKGQISKENPTVAFFVYPATSATNFHHSIQCHAPGQPGGFAPQLVARAAWSRCAAHRVNEDRPAWLDRSVASPPLR